MRKYDNFVYLVFYKNMKICHIIMYKIICNFKDNVINIFKSCQQKIMNFMIFSILLKKL